MDDFQHFPVQRRSTVFSFQTIGAELAYWLPAGTGNVL
jgi:hypothetical protein